MLIMSKINESLKIDYNIIGGALGKDFILRPYSGDKNEQFKENIITLSKPLQDVDYKTFWTKYENNRIRELKNEVVFEAFRKFFSPEILTYMKTLSLNDFKRNLARIKGLFSK